MSSLDYFDSSALVKRYLAEIGSAWVQARCADPNRVIAIVNLGHLEISAAFAGKLRGNFLTQDEHRTARTALTADFRRQYQVLPVTDQRLTTAIDLTTRHRLRGYDAMHLAVAMLLNQALTNRLLPPLTFVAADNDLLDAASAEGLAVVNPNLHP